MTANGDGHDQATRRTLAAVAAVVVAHALAPARRRRRLVSTLLAATALLGGGIGWWAIATQRPTAMVVATGWVVASGVIGSLRAPSWAVVSTDGRGLFHNLSSFRTERTTRDGRLTEQLLFELRLQADGVTPPSRAPYPTSAAVDANLDRIGALDLYYLPAQVLVAGQLATPARRWLERVVPGCVDGAVALAGTVGYRERTVGGVAAATARALREPLPAGFGETPPPAGRRARRRPAGWWAPTALLALVGVLGTALAVGSAWAVLDGFGPRRYVTLTGRLDLTGSAAVADGLASATPTHRFLLDDEGFVAVVDDAGARVRTDATNRPVGAPTGRLVAVSIDPTSIPAGVVTVYRTDRGDWSVDPGAAGFTQQRPAGWSLWVLAALALTSLCLVAGSLLDVRRIRMERSA